jgi:hypothetical protein
MNKQTHKANRQAIAASNVIVADTTVEGSNSAIFGRFTFDDAGAHLLDGQQVTPAELVKVAADSADKAAAASLMPLMLADFARTLPDVTVDNGVDPEGKALSRKVSAFDYVMENAAEQCKTPSAWSNVKGNIEPMAVAKVIAPETWVKRVFHVKEAIAFLKENGVIEKVEGKWTLKNATSPIVLALQEGKPIGTKADGTDKGETLRKVLWQERKALNDAAFLAGKPMPYGQLKGYTPPTKPEVKPETPEGTPTAPAANAPAPAAPAPVVPMGAPAPAGAPANNVAPVDKSGDDVTIAKQNLGSALASLKLCLADCDRALGNAASATTVKKTLAVALADQMKAVEETILAIHKLASPVQK